MMLHNSTDNAAIPSGTIKLFVLPQNIWQITSPSGLSLYFSIDFRKKNPETMKKKSTEMFTPLNLSDKTGKNP
jgi:hypothetical protein